MSRFTRILVALSGDELDRELLATTERLVRAVQPAELHVVTAAERAFPATCWSRGLEAARARQMTELEELAGLAGITRFLPVVVEGPPLDGILHHALDHKVDLVLVGRHRAGHSSGLAQHLALAAPCAVWMVPAGAPATLNRIVVATDFSQASRLALETAVGLCHELGLSELTVLNVCATPATPGIDPLTDAARLEAFHRFAGEASSGDVTLRPAFEHADDVVDGVAAAARRLGADLVCMGSRGQSRAAAMLLGAVTGESLRKLECPVLVVRVPGKVASLAEVFLRRLFTEQDRPRVG